MLRNEKYPGSSGVARIDDTLRTTSSMSRGRSLFKDYKIAEKVIEKPVKEVKKSPGLETLKALWKAYKILEETLISKRMPEIEYYRALCKHIKSGKISYTAKDVESFSLLLEEFEHEENFYVKAGMFLSAIINSGKEKSYIIHVENLGFPIDFLGYKNKKEIIVFGDLGNYVAWCVKKGKVIVNGSVGSNLADGGEKGEICVEKDVGLEIGKSTLSDSEVKIRIKGEIRDGDGKIVGINGISEECYAKVYHKGKLIWADGKPVEGEGETHE